MAEKVYVVLEGQKYVGKHRVYTQGMEFPASEIFEGTLLPSMNGTKDKRDDKGRLSIKGKPAKIKLKGGGSSGRPSDKKDNK